MPALDPRLRGAGRRQRVGGGLLVYAVMAADEVWKAVPPGVGGTIVRRVVAGDLAAAVSRVARRDETPDVTRALQYAAVVEALYDFGTIVPMRYGCVVADVGALVKLLVRRCKEYRRLLATVDGCAEMGVRLVLPGVAAPKPADASSHGAPPDLGPGAGYLRRRQAVYTAADYGQHLLGVAEGELRAAVGELVVATCAERRSMRPPAPGLPERALAFLVRRHHVEAFRAAVACLRDVSGARMRVSGPWPPYTFVTAKRAASLV